MAQIQILGMCDLDLGDITSGQGHDTPSSYCPETDFGYVCIVTLSLEVTWVKVMTPLGHEQQLCEILSRSNSEELWPVHGFWVCVHYALYLGYTTFVQAHDTPLGHGQ